MRVLIVAPRFPPTNAADCHRVRLILPYLAEFGWQAEVLAVEPASMAAPTDPWLAKHLPSKVPVHRVRAWALSAWGLNGLGQRAAVPLYRRGSELMNARDFDLVFFSTTEFLLHLLGPLWKRQFGVPFCMDYQDPWLTDYYRRHPETDPPGGRFKYGLVESLNRVSERFVSSRCGGFLAVSNSYLEDLDQRYGEAVKGLPRLVLPFPAEPSEFEGTISVVNRPCRPTTPPCVIRYVGVAGPYTEPAARAFFRAWRDLLDSGELLSDSLRFEAIGTSYVTDGERPRRLLSIAAEMGLDDRVVETPDRLGYHDMLTTLRESDGLVVFGSDDPAYTASKIYPYLLARRPLLGIFRRESPAVTLIDEVGGARCEVFGPDGFKKSSTQEIRKFLLDVASGAGVIPLLMDRLEPHCARAHAKQLVDWFSLMTRRFK